MPGLFVRWDSDNSTALNLISQASVKADQVCHDTASAIIDDIQASWSPTSPSEPGTPPAVVTGTLDESIRLRKTGYGDKLQYRVYAEVYYGALLEGGTVKMDARPFLKPAAERAATDFADNMTVVFKP